MTTPMMLLVVITDCCWETFCFSFVCANASSSTSSRKIHLKTQSDEVIIGCEAAAHFSTATGGQVLTYLP